MSKKRQLDCVVIGYNEMPFERYENFLRSYGEDTEAYRDLKFSFIDAGGRKLDYLGLLNSVVNAAHPDAAAYDDFKSGDIPNLAAVYLTNFLRNTGHAAEYINLFQHEKERLQAYLADDPYCVAITTTFYVVNLPVVEMVEFIREQNPRVKIVVGGPLIANHARNFQGAELEASLKDLGGDIYVIEGQGEATLDKIVSCLKAGGSLSGVPNLAYFEGGALRRTRLEPENNSLDENFIDWRNFAGAGLGATIQTRTARSCAFKCSFCNYPARAGALTLTNLPVIEQELDSIRALPAVRNVVFIDDTFNVPLPRFKEVCQLMIQKDYGFDWFSYFRCSNSDEEAIELMAKSGCKGVFLGIESGSPEILKNMTKAATLEKYVKGMELLHQYGIMTFASFIVGFPGETEQTVRETVDFIRATRPDYYRAQMWYCEPGTPVYRDRDKFRIEGDGFVWTHATMDSLTAMEQIERMFLTIRESAWLPQWSFDFWVIPYLLGRGISPDRFRSFMGLANKLLALEIASLRGGQKEALQREYMQDLTNLVRAWPVPGQ